ncbi:3-isopropylmalate dehydratase large subunit [Candidatus Gottesmanbacteria bacterium RIFCSPHIGHO2_02_FULL_40_13]|uniref:3-isopropylmalate dehydratase large subunit n=1 Tax=Candidatus Gottesmanbacteria bacterium RIFCSPHIGHO2_02_FULL_40_13 TaxID=1798384 RepID=A0A1F6ABL7_9BACT|nr:MAG: 3-isopropylmalate dehydratase large subunit [Candidatus Gottesmanbacteria bacterium RIFCSPHIGHO2_02_FULL_40_13]
MKAKTLFEKIWGNHMVFRRKNSPSLLYLDVHYVHEVTSPQAFYNLRKKKLKVRCPERTFAACDHNVSTINQNEIRDKLSGMQIDTLVKNCRDFGIRLYGLDSSYQGIVHVIGPELGITQPGMTIVCGDSHTSTHGAFGCLAFGIGTTEIEHVLASQCLLQNPMKTMEINIDGKLGKGVTTKDVILTVLTKIGTKGGTGFAIEYSGSLIRKMNMEERMTICNMSIEAGARCGMVAPDRTTFAYLKGRQFTPKGNKWNEAINYWQTLKTDENAQFDKSVIINGNNIEPLVTWGTDPSTGIKISEKIPSPETAQTPEEKMSREKALAYMNLKPGRTLEGFSVDYIFIGSCTNARISDLRQAAAIVKGKKVSGNVVAIVVPGSRQVKFQAEKEGLNKIFIEAGFQWRWSGCSACIAMNEDKIPSGKYCISTSNRNYEGRQGPGARTFLASPITAAACAIEGKIADVRKFL